METAQVTANGMITVPAPVRRKLGLREGSRILFEEKDNGFLVVAEPADSTFKMSEEEIEAAVKRGWTREYIEAFLQFGKEPDLTFVAPPDLPPQDRGELFE